MTLSTDARRREIKFASHDLIKAVCNKLEGAQDLIGIGKSQAQRCGSENDETHFLNLWHVAELERRSTIPFVTRLMCKLAGGMFLPLPEQFDDAGALPLHVLELARETGDVSAAVVDALKDGVVRESEAAAIEEQVQELADKALQMLAHLRAMQGKAPAPLREVGAA